MTYRTLLILLDQAPSADARTRIALRLANLHESHLTGLAPTGLIELPIATATVAGIGEFAERARQALRERAQRVIDRFGDDCRTADAASAEARIDESDKAASLLRHARSADLVIVSQAEPRSVDFRETSELIERAVLESGRPVLIVPYVGAFDSVGSNVMVAWDESREAARALADALPLLRFAGKVELVSWNEGNDEDHAAALRKSLDAVREWLLRHHIKAEAHVDPGSEIGIANLMLSHAADQGADLIVMGAWGHARWAERMLGGATRELLASMTVPVLMSH